MLIRNNKGEVVGEMKRRRDFYGCITTGVFGAGGLTNKVVSTADSLNKRPICLGTFAGTFVVHIQAMIRWMNEVRLASDPGYCANQILHLGSG